jgi:hypothetical protein
VKLLLLYYYCPTGSKKGLSRFQLSPWFNWWAHTVRVRVRPPQKPHQIIDLMGFLFFPPLDLKIEIGNWGVNGVYFSEAATHPSEGQQEGLPA